MTLNELVAVEVMGAPVIRITDPVPAGMYVIDGVAWQGGGKTGKHFTPFYPSTSIADAWEVVEKMRAGGWLFKLDDNGKDRLCTAAWFHKCKDGFCIDAEGVAYGLIKNEAKLICLAALRAVGVSEERIGEACK